MVGPTLIHYRKNFPTYLFFASTIVGHKKDLERLRVFGTDGEKALFQAFGHEFRLAVHLTCFIHVRRNIMEMLHSLPEHTQKEILDDIFGKQVGTTFLEGLVDSSEVSFDEKLDFLLGKWKDAGPLTEFCDWFVKNKVDVIRQTMLRSVSEEAGLGSPPAQFSTNASEAVNNLIKQKVDYKRHELPSFIGKLRELCDEQEREVERAVVRRGKYRFRPQYRHLEISESIYMV